MDDENGQERRSRRSPRRSPLRLILTVLIVVIVPLALGLFLAPRLIPKPKVGIVRLNNDIVGESTFEISKQLEYARNDPAVKAAVLIINSPGGSAAYSEELFLDVLHTREEMPVVATVDLLAASGAYYMATAADEIYAKPTSTVGSIGVIAFLPGPVFIEDDLLTTGPYKAFGGTRDSMMRQMEMAKEAFLEAVVAGRGDRLKSDPTQLARAEVFSGVQAEEMGLIDGLLATDEAIERAAEMAGLSSYEVVELYPLAFSGLFENVEAGRYHPPAVDPQTLWAPPLDLPAGLYYRYIEPLPIK